MEQNHTDGFHAIDELECHFTWRPEQGSTKFHMGEMIQKTKGKTDVDRHLKVAHLTTIAYLFTCESVADFAKAEELLNEAAQCDEEIRKNGTNEHQVSGIFVIRADILHLKHLKNQLNQQDLERELKELSDLWSDNSIKASTYGVKGYILSLFGPTKMDISVQSFAAAVKLEPKSFHWNYGIAFMLARIARKDRCRNRAETKQIEFWRRARQLGEESCLADASFYAFFAEAIVNNNELTRVCEEMANESTSRIIAMKLEDKVKYQVVYSVCLKVYRILLFRYKKETQQQSWSIRAPVNSRGDNRSREIPRLPQYETRIADLAKDAETISEHLNDSALFLELANRAEQLGQMEKALTLLQVGERHAGEIGHVWIGTRIIEFKVKLGIFNEDQADAAWLSLKAKFSKYESDPPAIEFKRALCLIGFGSIDKAINSCITAVKQQSSLHQVSMKDRFDFYNFLRQNQNNREEFLAFFVSNVTSYTYSGTLSNKDIEELYKTALVRNERNDFALEHLGRFYLKNGMFSQAISCFQKLPDEHEDRNRLLAQSLLSNPASDIHMLTQCLKLGCRDAATKILDLLHNRKSCDSSAQQVMSRILGSSDAAQHPLFFDRAVYELCARINIVMQDSDSFSFQTEETHDLVQVTQRVQHLFELKDSFGLESLQSNAVDASPDCTHASLMRSNRLRVTNLKLLDFETNKQEVNKLIVSVLTGAKHVMDRSSSIGMQDMNDQMSSSPQFDSRDLIKFMLRNQHRILSREHRWIIRWIDLVSNGESENDEILVKRLEDQLRSDWSCDGDCMTAYDVAHLAAEFAEEMWAVFSGVARET